jgi:phosphatidylglycerophosphate synthase
VSTKATDLSGEEGENRQGAKDVRALNGGLAPDLERFSRRHALVIGGGALFSLWVGDLRALVLAGAVSFASLFAVRRGAYTKRGRFGVANIVTLGRLALGLGLALAVHGEAGEIWAGALIGILCLDWLDGYLARRSGDSSDFGSYFDMEADAFIVLLACFELFQRERLGPWVLVGGALRYGYVLFLWGFPSDLGEAPRSSFGRWAFFALFIGLTLPFVLPGVFGLVPAAFGTLLVCVSFGRSFVHWAQGRRLMNRARAAARGPTDSPR